MQKITLLGTAHIERWWWWININPEQFMDISLRVLIESLKHLGAFKTRSTLKPRILPYVHNKFQLLQWRTLLVVPSGQSLRPGVKEITPKRNQFWRVSVNVLWTMYESVNEIPVRPFKWKLLSRTFLLTFESVEGIVNYEHSPESYGTAPTVLLFTMLNKVVLTVECVGEILKRFYFELGDICRRIHDPSNLHRERSTNGHHDSLPFMIHSHKKWHLIYLQRRMFKLQCNRFTITYGICLSRQVRNRVWKQIDILGLNRSAKASNPPLRHCIFCCHSVWLCD